MSIKFKTNQLLATRLKVKNCLNVNSLLPLAWLTFDAYDTLSAPRDHTFTVLGLLSFVEPKVIDCDQSSKGKNGAQRIVDKIVMIVYHIAFGMNLDKSMLFQKAVKIQ